MHAGNPVLIEFIRETIRRRGPVTFAWFMEQALYHPELGYYSSGRSAIGRRGDYFTNVSVGPLFGRLLAVQFTEMWELMGRPDNFVIVEQGAHQGDFARDVLGALSECAPDFFSGLRYLIIEPFPILRERQMETLCDFSEKLSWEKLISDLAPFNGVHFSNELLDAMPVHLICRTRAGWEERCVEESGDGFGFVTAPITDPELQRHLETIPGDLPEPYETEVNLAALRWIDCLASKLTRGYVLAVDYGHAREEFYASRRRTGTLQCYARHRIMPSPLSGVGEIDITAHVDWTSVVSRGKKIGLGVAGFTDQHHFVTGIAAAFLPAEFTDRAEARTRRALQTLLHPELLGTTFQFLGLAKNIAPEMQLSGFKFGRAPTVRLGL